MGRVDVVRGVGLVVLDLQAARLELLTGRAGEADLHHRVAAAVGDEHPRGRPGREVGLPAVDDVAVAALAGEPLGAAKESRLLVEVAVEDALEAEEELGRNVLEVARLQARARRLKVRARLIRTRNPGKTIVAEAIERHSDLIYISTEHAPSDERLLGPTTRHVLANRPCRVVVEGGKAPSEPGPAGDGRPPSSAGRHTAAGERSPKAA